MRPLNVLIADPHPLTRGAIVRALGRAPGTDVLAAVGATAELLSALKDHRADVVVLDLDLPDMDALRTLDVIRNNHPDVEVVILSSERDPARFELALAGGASACLLKAVQPDDLAAALRQAVDRTLFTALPAAQVPVAEESAAANLTDRERTMLDFVARGCSNKEIATELWVTEQTVKFHLNNLYRKLGVSNRTAAARYAYEHGLAGDAATASADGAPATATR